MIERRLNCQRAGRPKASQALLTHALWCTGRRVYSAARHGGRYRLHGRGSHTFPIDYIDGQLLQNLAGLRFSGALQAAIVAHVTNHSHDAERDALRARQRDYDARLTRVKDMYESGAIDRAEFQQRFTAINAAMAETRKALMQPGEVETVMSYLTTLAETLNHISIEHRRKAIYHLIERCDIAEDGTIERVQLREWARAAFNQLIHAARAVRLNVALDRCRENNLAGSLAWWQRVAA